VNVHLHCIVSNVPYKVRKYSHRRIQDFFRGRLKDEFIRKCTGCTAVKTQLLMGLFLTNMVDNHTRFG